jgi:GAF domain-containing protein
MYRAPVTPDADLLARLDALAELLPLLSAALDIRDVFSHVSRIAHRVLPHDSLALALVAPDRQSLFVHAISGEVDFARPDRLVLPPAARDLFDSPWAYLLCDDMREDPIMRELPPVSVGLRSSLRVPLLRDGRTFGGLNFLSRDIGHFTTADVPVAQRVAAYVALTLAHQDLAQ